MDDHIDSEIQKSNPWYTGSHFDWAQAEHIKRIYEQRYIFFKQVIEAQIAKKGQIKLLDYGCGDGYWCLRLSKIAHCAVTGVDYNPLRIERAKAMAPGVLFYQADLSKANNDLGGFDIVLCSQVIEHVQDDEGFLRNLKQYLGDDARLVLGTPNEGCLTQRFRNWLTKEETDHCHFYTEREVLNKIKSAGFVVTDTMREVFYPGNDWIYYKLTSFDAGFKFLQWCARWLPSQCSDYYFAAAKA